MPIGGRHAPGAGAPRAQRLLLRASTARTGEVLSADAVRARQRLPGVDLKTRRAADTTRRRSPEAGKVVRDICPAAPGAQGLAARRLARPRTRPALHPAPQPLQGLRARCEANYIAGTPYVGADVKMSAGPGGNRGAFTAWDPVARREGLADPRELPVWSGALATAGDVVFYGTMDGWFKAVDARTGKPLWQFKSGLGNHRPAHHLSRARRQAVRGRAGRRRRLGRAPWSPPGSTRATAPPRSASSTR